MHISSATVTFFMFVVVSSADLGLGLLLSKFV
jgi:hypothetical protein